MNTERLTLSVLGAAALALSIYNADCNRRPAEQRAPATQVYEWEPRTGEVALQEPYFPRELHVEHDVEQNGVPGILVIECRLVSRPDGPDPLRVYERCQEVGWEPTGNRR